MEIDITTRLNLAFEMWERAHGRPLADDTVETWVTAAGYDLEPGHLTKVRRGDLATLPEQARAGLAHVFGLDPSYFVFDPGPDRADDAEVIAHLDNSALRRLGQAVNGVSLRTLLYLESVAEVLRQADGLPPCEQTAQL
ncbi:hypothetical protein ACWEPH_09920 [Nocardia beijingensis]|uniref:XRE family transcriptional regulator n=1 Tax=Nocardia beijingensis TaxID=95162 RepID=A0ABW7WPG4_9NOCA|nr:hypothetical protein [Nocardia beijingensis]MBF6078117.1 hypothetical protein [Nocardia beijingensis]